MSLAGGLRGRDMAASVPESSGIFISYRRGDTPYAAGWLFDRLADHFGPAQVFQDVDSIQLGEDFLAEIAASVGSCSVLLAVIGTQWLAVKSGDGRRRIDDPKDFVRVEIEAALTRGVLVIPVLADGAQMPRANELPASLAELARRQALELRPDRFKSDTDHLLGVLDAELRRAVAETVGPVPVVPSFPQSSPPEASSELSAGLATKPATERPTEFASPPSDGEPATATVTPVHPPSGLTPERHRQGRSGKDGLTRISALTGLAGLGSIAFSPDGLALAAHTHEQVILWDVTDPSRPIRAATLTHQSGSVRTMVFSPVGRTMVTAAVLGHGRATNNTEVILWDLANLRRPSRITTFEIRGWINAFAFSLDSRTMVTVGEDVTLWDLSKAVTPRLWKSKPTKISDVDDHAVTAAFSPDGQLLATANAEYIDYSRGKHEGEVTLWEIGGQAGPVRISVLPRRFQNVHTVHFLPDGRTLIAVHRGGVTLWDLTDLAFPPRFIADLYGDDGKHRVVAFSLDGRLLAAIEVNDPGEVTLWDVAERSQPILVTTLTGLVAANTVALSPDGATLATVGGVPDSMILWRTEK